MAETNGIDKQESLEQADLGSNWGRLLGVLMEPKETFREIGQRPNILIPLVMIMLIAVLATVFVIDQLGYENIIRRQIEQNPQIRDMPADQREELIASQQQSQVVLFFSYAGAPIFGVIAILIVAALLLMGVRLVGSESPFKQIFSVALHSYFAHGVVSSVLLCLVVFVKEDKSEIDVQDAVLSHAGLLVDKFGSPVLYTLASSFDLLTFYVMFLLALGLSTIDRRLSFGGAAGVVLFFWVLWVALKVGFAAIFSS